MIKTNFATLKRSYENEIRKLAELVKSEAGNQIIGRLFGIEEKRFQLRPEFIGDLVETGCISIKMEFDFSIESERTNAYKELANIFGEKKMERILPKITEEAVSSIFCDAKVEVIIVEMKEWGFIASIDIS